MGKFSEDDAQGRIKVDEWKDALSELGSFNGISYNRELKEIVAYKKDIVSNICHSIEPDIKWDDSHVQGKSNICEVVCKNIEQVGLSRRYNVKVVGLYGVGGIGKTTLCKTLWNELSREYEGRVCHVEFESKGTSSKGLLEKVLMRLTNTSLEVLQRMNEGEYRDILQRTLSSDKTFLAVDNVWDDHQSLKQAKMFLEGPFCEGSLVIVTSRSQRTLELLGVHGDASFEVPDLGLEDAMNLFLYHAAGGKKFVQEGEKDDISECLERCYFKNGDGGWHYHPLAVEALGLQLSCLGDKPSEWVENLQRVKNFSYLSGQNPVFGILRSSFDLLPLCDQSLFMDLVVYRPFNSNNYSPWEFDLKEWLCLVHKQDEVEIKCRLDCLKRRGLLQDVDLASGEVRMHDLYREFAELEVRGKLDESTDLEKRRWGYVDDGDLSELESSPSARLSHKLIRLVLKFSRRKNITESLEVINWQYCSNVVVLKLEGDLRWRGVLSWEPLKCLKSFSLQGVRGLDRVEGLEGLKNLTYFTWDNYNPRHFGRGERERTQMGRFPASLVVLEIDDTEVLFGPDVLARCTKLRTLKLWSVQAGTLDVSNCSSLQTLEVREVDDLRTLSGLTARSGLKSLQVLDCRNLDDVPGLEQVAGLEQLVLASRRSMVHLQLELQKLTKLQAVEIHDELFSSLCLPLQLQELTLGPSWISSTNAQGEVLRRRMIEALKANRLEQLQVLRLHGCDLSGLENVGGWPALRCLDLSWCRSLSRLPDLSQSTNLEELDLMYSDGELCEDDVCMLARLRQLQPVPIGHRGDVRLDLVRRKELKYSSHRFAPSAWVDWKEHEWHERDLGIPPHRFQLQCTVREVF